MQFAHPRQNRLSGLRIRVHPKRGILLGQLLDRHPQLFLVGLGLVLHRELDDRHRKLDRFQHHRVLVVADGIAGRN